MARRKRRNSFDPQVFSSALGGKRRGKTFLVKMFNLISASISPENLYKISRLFRMFFLFSQNSYDSHYFALSAIATELFWRALKFSKSNKFCKFESKILTNFVLKDHIKDRSEKQHFQQKFPCKFDLVGLSSKILERTRKLLQYCLESFALLCRNLISIAWKPTSKAKTIKNYLK